MVLRENNEVRRGVVLTESWATSRNKVRQEGDGDRGRAGKAAGERMMQPCSAPPTPLPAQPPRRPPQPRRKHHRKAREI